MQASTTRLRQQHMRAKSCRKSAGVYRNIATLRTHDVHASTQSYSTLTPNGFWMAKGGQLYVA